MAAHAGELGLGLGLVGTGLLEQVPLALLAPAEADRAVRRDEAAALLVEDDGLPLGVVGLAEVVVEVGRAQVAVGHVALAILAQHDLHRQVGVLARVLGEVRVLLLDQELLQRDVAHGQEGGGVGALLDRHPQVGELDVLGVVRRHRHDLGALVAHFGGEVGVGGTGHRQVGAGDDQVGRVVPVGGLGHVGLLAPGLRRRGGQVAIPVVERAAGGADQRQVAGTGGVRDHRHRGNRREAVDAVRAPLLDRVHVGRGDDLGDLVPAGAHEAAQATHVHVLLALGGILLDRLPGLDRVTTGLALGAVQVEQTAADHRVLDAVRRVQVPRERGTTLAAARLVVGQVLAGARVVGLLHLERHQAVLDEDLPRTAARAVHAVGGAHHLVVAPAVAVGILPVAVFIGDDTVSVREGLLDLVEKPQAIEKMTHGLLLSSRRFVHQARSVKVWLKRESVGRAGIRGSGCTRLCAGRTTS